MAAYLAKNPNVDVLCAHESWTCYRYLGQLKGMGKTPDKDIVIACFDSSSGILPYLKDGEVVAACDQQQYLQGFLPLFDLYLCLTKGKVHPVSVVTGMLIDRSNADSIQEGAWAGYRQEPRVSALFVSRACSIRCSNASPAKQHCRACSHSARWMLYRRINQGKGWKDLRFTSLGLPRPGGPNGRRWWRPAAGHSSVESHRKIPRELDSFLPGRWPKIIGQKLAL
jgi:hypothetical protein